MSELEKVIKVIAELNLEQTKRKIRQNQLDAIAEELVSLRSRIVRQFHDTITITIGADKTTEAVVYDGITIALSAIQKEKDQP